MQNETPRQRVERIAEYLPVEDGMPYPDDAQFLLDYCRKLQDVAEAADRLESHLGVFLPALPRTEKLQQLHKAGTDLIYALAALDRN
jgi:hypothetical protein